MDVQTALNTGGDPRRVVELLIMADDLTDEVLEIMAGGEPRHVVERLNDLLAKAPEKPKRRKRKSDPEVEASVEGAEAEE